MYYPTQQIFEAKTQQAYSVHGWDLTMTTLTDGTISNNVAVDAASSWSYVQFETNVVSLPVFHVLQRKATGRDSNLPNKP